MQFKNVKEIRNLIRASVQDKIDAGQRVSQEWQAAEILNEFTAIDGAHKDFYYMAALQFVSDEVKKICKLYDPEEMHRGSESIILPGFERLQKAYVLKRRNDSGEFVELVPIDQLADANLEAVAEGCRVMADILATMIGRVTVMDPGLYADQVINKTHAAEIRQYLAARNGVELINS